MLNAFYDLSVSPAKYDFVGFLLDAERARIFTNQDYIRFIFVPGPNDGFRKDTLPPYSTEYRRAMLNNIVFPMCFMLPTKNKFINCKTPDDAWEYFRGDVFPAEYTINKPVRHYGTDVIVSAFKDKFYPLKALRPIEKQSDLITITLRESHYWPYRNSNRDTWLKAGEIIRKSGLRVQFIPDTDSKPLEGADELAAIDLHRRAALYESAAHNFFVSNGPAWMAACMEKVNGTMFKLLAEKSVCTHEGYFESIGFPVGSQIGRDGFRLIWKDDDQEHVIPEIERVIKELK